VLVAPAVLGVTSLLVVTRRGAYLTPDALAYVGTARNIAHGHGFTPPPGSPPVSNFAPLYTLVLAAGSLLGADPLTVARYLNPLVFGATIVLVGLLVRRLTGSLALAVVAQALVLSGRDFLAYHSAALSEPLFVLFALLALATLAVFSSRGGNARLLTASLFAAAAGLTRYVGLAVAAAGAAALMLFARDRRPWKAVAIFLALALLPLLVWLAWAGGEAKGINRSPVLHAPGLSYLSRGVETASRWVLPSDAPWPVQAAALVLVAAGLLWAARASRPRGAQSAERDRRRSALAGVLGLFSAAYLLALIGDRTLFDVTGRLDARFLLPVHATALALAAWALRAVDLRHSRLAQLGVGAFVGVQLVSGSLWITDAATDAAVRPGGFAAPEWVQSQVIADTRALAPSVPVFTNDVGALFFHTGRVAEAVPEKAIPLTGRANRAYDAQIHAMAASLRRGGVVLYLTAAPARRVFLPTPAEIVGRLGLKEVTRDRVGVLYRMPGGP
jgi:4-amino-4-deoxy-L-arabinose transferase-like glycosyltransferase